MDEWDVGRPVTHTHLQRNTQTHTMEQGFSLNTLVSAVLRVRASTLCDVFLETFVLTAASSIIIHQERWTVQVRMLR